jgi:hypothetical protein
MLDSLAVEVVEVVERPDRAKSTWIKLPDFVIKNLVEFLQGSDVVRLDTALVNHECREILYEGFKNATVLGFKFRIPLNVPSVESTSDLDDQLCEGLQWALKREIDTRDFDFWIDHGRLTPTEVHPPLNELITLGRRELVRHIIDRCELKKIMLNSDRTSGNADGFSPLHYLAQYNDVELLRLLLEKEGISEFMQGESQSDRATPLHVAAVEQKLDVLELLVKDGRISINAKAQHGTPLHYAVKKDMDMDTFDIVRVLVDGGAHVNARSQACQGKTPLGLLNRMHFYGIVAATKKKIVDYLVDNGGVG